MNESENMSLQEESQKHHYDSEMGEHGNSSLPIEESQVEVTESQSTHSKEIKEFRKKKEEKDSYSHSDQFESFKSAFDKENNLETKLQLAIDFMTASLSHGETPHFRSFWEARLLCLPLFKENISPALRGQLWLKYSELSKEARRLKEILDEQSAFAVEQIEIAITALENDISHFEEQLQKHAFPESLVTPKVLKDHFSVYQDLQRQLNILNAQASRINALRKELLKTEMRVRHKNKFFQRLSAAGDLVFPKRKELIKQVSSQFSQDVELFINTHFKDEEAKESLFILREEIKALQGLAKLLTLNTQSFTQTRNQLSECWDRIKTEEKERKKERAQQRVVFKQNYETIEKQIISLKDAFEKNEESPTDASKKMEGIISQMRKVELGRDELKLLREALGEIRQLVHQKLKVEEDTRQFQENERNRQKKERFRDLKNEAEKLMQEHDSKEINVLTAERDSLLQQIQDSPLTKNEKQEIERLLKPLRDYITEKKEKDMMALSEDDRQALQQLKQILEQRKVRRQDIKNQLEVLRKAAGSSGLDIVKAMSYASQINEENDRLEKANQSILEIERKITELKTKITG